MSTVRHCVVLLGPAQSLVLNHGVCGSQLNRADSMSQRHGWHMTQASQTEVRLYPSLVETGSECVQSVCVTLPRPVIVGVGQRGFFAGTAVLVQCQPRANVAPLCHHSLFILAEGQKGGRLKRQIIL